MRPLCNRIQPLLHASVEHIETAAVIPMENEVLELDGSQGEGGGQILRTSVSLAAILSRAVSITKIRSGRPKPGLAAQHLAGINLVGEISDGSVLSGNAMQSTQLKFQPGNVVGTRKSYFADPKTAGSITLMFQIALPVLLHSLMGEKDGGEGEGVEATLCGGTNVLASPPIEHTLFVLLPLIERMVRDSNNRPGVLKGTVQRTGWFPRGGGRVKLHISPFRDLAPLNLTSKVPTPSKIDIFISSQQSECEWQDVLHTLRQQLKSSFKSFSHTASAPLNIHVNALTLARTDEEDEDGDEAAADKAPDHRHHKKKRKKGGLTPKQRVFALSIVAHHAPSSDTTGGILFTNHEDLSTISWSTETEQAVEAAVCEVSEMIQSGACVDERTADQLIIYNSLALLRQKERIQEEERDLKDAAALIPRKFQVTMIIPRVNHRASSLHLSTVMDIVMSFIEGLSITIVDGHEESKCREIHMALE